MKKPNLTPESLAQLTSLFDEWLKTEGLTYEQLDSVLIEWRGETLSAQANCGKAFYCRDFCLRDCIVQVRESEDHQWRTWTTTSGVFASSASVEISTATRLPSLTMRQVREIKFRAWIPQAKEWINDVDLKDLWSSGRALEEHGTSRYEAENIQGVRWTFDDLIFVQYTGLKDKYGHEVYDGDILAPPGMDWSSYQVVWDEKRLAWMGKPPNGLCYLKEMNMRLYRVVGNIYQNPELINDPTP